MPVMADQDHEAEGRALRAAFQPRIGAAFQPRIPTRQPEPEIPREATPSELVIDQAGDLHLEVGGNHRDEPVSFIVCSKTLARKSPIFKIMLFGPFAESKHSATGEWAVQLPDDHPQVFRILMDIIHANFAAVPVSLDSDVMQESSEHDLLCEIARMTDKYDMVDVVRPWINTWNENSYEFYASDAEAPFHGQLTWIAWVFGDEKLLRAGLDAVAVHAWMLDRDDDTSKGAIMSNFAHKGRHQSKKNNGSDVWFTDWQDNCISLRGPGEKNEILDLLDISGMSFPHSGTFRLLEHKAVANSPLNR